MSLFRKLFNRKPPDGLLEICDRVFVFDCCFSIDSWDEEDYKVYMAGVVNQLLEHFPDASSLVFNFRELGSPSVVADFLSEHDFTIMDYPRHYEGCSLLPVEVMHHFLRSSESWLSLGPSNLLLMHCERGAWPVLAFMLAALLIYRKQYSGELKALDMIYKQAPRELLHLFSPLNPIPSQLRYLQYVSRRNLVSEWPPLDRALTMDCVILRLIPIVSGQGGFRPIFRIYGQDPSLEDDKKSKLLYSTPKNGKHLRIYKQAECEIVKIDIKCGVQGDIVIECVNLNNDMEKEVMLFRVVFNTAFISSNILMLNRDEVDTLWHMKEEFPKGFRAELIFSDIDAASSVGLMDFPPLEEKDGLPMEAFPKLHEIFDEIDWLDQTDATHNMLQDLAIANAVQDIPDGTPSLRLQGLSPVRTRVIMKQAEIEHSPKFKLSSMSELETGSVLQISSQANTTNQDATKLLHEESSSLKIVHDSGAVKPFLKDSDLSEIAKENILKSPPPEDNGKAVSPWPSTPSPPHHARTALAPTGAPPLPPTSEPLQHTIVQQAEPLSSVSLPVSTFHETTSDIGVPMAMPETPPPLPPPSSEPLSSVSLPVSTFHETTSDIELPVATPPPLPPSSHNFSQAYYSKPHVSEWGPEER